MSDSEPSYDVEVAEVPPAQRALLERYVELLLEANRTTNLTAIRERDEAWSRHVIETLRVLPLLGEGKTLIDVGAGGGIPGLVVAIARPDLEVTLLEATEKKARFLRETAKTLKLANVTVLAERAEIAAQVGQKHREFFDIATARAVASLRVLFELTIPFLKPYGRFVAIKGERAHEEIAEAQTAMSVLGVSLSAAERHPTATVLVFHKTQPTPPKYPRRAGEPKRNPL